MNATHVVGGPIGSSAPDGWYTTAQAAELIGRSGDTLRRWRENGIGMPSGVMKAGTLDVNLYSEDDINTLREIAKTMKAGRPRKESDGEHHASL